MHRTQIYFSENEWAILKLMANASKESVSELIRQAVRRVYADKNRLDFDRALSGISGLWADRPMDTHEYVRNLRRGSRSIA